MDIPELDERIFAFLKRRIERLGIDDSGAWGFYQGRLDANQGGLSVYDRSAYEYLKDRPRVMHVGIGFGTLTAALASAGVKTVGFENHPLRYDGAVELAAFLGVEDTIDLRCESFPAALRSDEPTSDTTLVFTNFGAITEDWVEPAIIATFPRFDSVLLDLRLFCRTRDEEERDELSARLIGLGYRLNPVHVRQGYHLVELTR